VLSASIGSAAGEPCRVTTKQVRYMLFLGKMYECMTWIEQIKINLARLYKFRHFSSPLGKERIFDNAEHILIFSHRGIKRFASRGNEDSVLMLYFFIALYTQGKSRHRKYRGAAERCLNT